MCPLDWPASIRKRNRAYSRYGPGPGVGSTVAAGVMVMADGFALEMARPTTACPKSPSRSRARSGMVRRFFGFRDKDDRSTNQVRPIEDAFGQNRSAWRDLYEGPLASTGLDQEVQLARRGNTTPPLPISKARPHAGLDALFDPGTMMAGTPGGVDRPPRPAKGCLDDIRAPED